MLTVNKLIPQGRGLARVLLQRAASVELDWDTRARSRFEATDSTGRHLGVFLPRGTVVRGGDVLVAEDGSLLVVRAAAQAVLRVRHSSEHGQPSDLLKAAYHLGNRHVPVQLAADHLQLEPDHVLAEMLRRMHLVVTEESAAFEPEGGAYEGGHEHQASGHRHAHDHAHGHDHAHRHDHAHEHEHHGGHVHAHKHEHHRAHEHAHGHDHTPGNEHHDHHTPHEH